MIGLTWSDACYALAAAFALGAAVGVRGASFDMFALAVALIALGLLLDR